MRGHEPDPSSACHFWHEIREARGQEALTPAALQKASREFGLTPVLARELVADVCERIDGARTDALHLAEQRAGAHPVLEVMDDVVRLITETTRRVLLAG